MDELRSELTEWVASKSISSSGFMPKPADLQQQLYAQREIAIRELSLEKKSPSSEKAPTPPDSEKNAKIEVENSENTSQADTSCTTAGDGLEENVDKTDETYPLLNSCLIALDVDINYLNVLPTLIMINSMVENMPEVSENMFRTHVPEDFRRSGETYFDALVSRLINLVSKAAQKPTTIRLTSVYLSCKLLQWLHAKFSDSYG